MRSTATTRVRSASRDEALSAPRDYEWLPIEWHERCRCANQILVFNNERSHVAQRSCQAFDATMAHLTRLSESQARIRPGPVRGAKLGRLSSPCNGLHCSIWLPSDNSRRLFPLRSSAARRRKHRAAPARSYPRRRRHPRRCATASTERCRGGRSLQHGRAPARARVHRRRSPRPFDANRRGRVRIRVSLRPDVQRRFKGVGGAAIIAHEQTRAAQPALQTRIDRAPRQDGFSNRDRFRRTAELRELQRNAR